MSTKEVPLLEMVEVSKRYPGVLANDRVSFSLERGQKHALLGENGAGKSTLVKMIYGVSHPDSGSLLWNGERFPVSNPKAARAAGIGMVFQHFSLFQALSVMENIALGMDTKLSYRELEAEIRRVLDTYQLTLDPHRMVSSLSVGEQQRIEIVRALLLDPKLLIMDEPTSVLTPQEVEQLFVVLNKLAAGGCSVLYISHKLQEVSELCDHATILRGGKVVGACNPREESSASMAEMMIGEKVVPLSRERGARSDEVKLKVDRLSMPKRSQFDTALDHVSFEAKAGVILGIAGVAGNGQNELVEAISGELLSENPSAITLDGEVVGDHGPSARRQSGLCTVPEERNGHAAVPAFSLADNGVLTARDRRDLVKNGLIKRGACHSYAAEVIAAFDVKARGPKAAASSLSGGNLQKFIMGREILQNPEVLVVSQPTWGVDPGAASAIRQALIDLAKGGAAIVVISQDLDELFNLCDELAVMNAGQLSETRPTASLSVEEIGLMMGGIHQSTEEGMRHGA